jgi:hypothetical protein
MKEPGLLMVLALLHAPIHRPSWKKNSRKFAVAGDSSTQCQSLDNRPCCTPLGSKHPDLVAVVAPMCIKGLRLVTMQLLEKSRPSDQAMLNFALHAFLGSSYPG